MSHLKIVFILAIVTSLYIVYDNSSLSSNVINNNSSSDKFVRHNIIKSLRAPADVQDDGGEYSDVLDFSTTTSAAPIEEQADSESEGSSDFLDLFSEQYNKTNEVPLDDGRILKVTKVKKLSDDAQIKDYYNLETSGDGSNKCHKNYKVEEAFDEKNAQELFTEFISHCKQLANSQEETKEQSRQNKNSEADEKDEEIDELLCVEEKGEDDYHECLRDNLEELHEKGEEDRKYKRAYNKAKGILVDHIAELAVSNQWDRAAREDYLIPLQEVAQEIGDRSLSQEVGFGGTLYNLVNNSIHIARIQTQLRQRYEYRYRQLAARRRHIERRGFNLEAQRQFNNELDMLNSEFDMASQGLMNLDPMIYANENNISGNALSIFQEQYIALEGPTEFEVLPFASVQNPVSQHRTGARSSRSVLGPHHTLPGTSIPANGTSVYGTTHYGMGARSSRSILGSQYGRIMPRNGSGIYNRGIQPRINYSTRGRLGPQYGQGMPRNGSGIYNRGMQPRIRSTRGGVNFHNPRTPLRAPLQRRGRY